VLLRWVPAPYREEGEGATIPERVWVIGKSRELGEYSTLLVGIGETGEQVDLAPLTVLDPDGERAMPVYSTLDNARKGIENLISTTRGSRRYEGALHSVARLGAGRYNRNRGPIHPPRAGPRFFFGIPEPNTLTLIHPLRMILVDLVRLELRCRLAEWPGRAGTSLARYCRRGAVFGSASEHFRPGFGVRGRRVRSPRRRRIFPPPRRRLGVRRHRTPAVVLSKTRGLTAGVREPAYAYIAACRGGGTSSRLPVRALPPCLP
jgi:hypothetical protein